LPVVVPYQNQAELLLLVVDYFFVLPLMLYFLFINT